MMIGIDIRSIHCDKTGIGQYFYNLILKLSEIDSSNNYILYTNRQPNLNLNGNFRIRYFFLPMICWQLRVALDVIISKIDVFYSPSMFFPIILKKRCFLFIPDMTNFMFPQFHTFKLRISTFFYKIAIERCYKIITISECSKRDIINLFPFVKGDGKIEAIYLAASEKYHIKEDDMVRNSIELKYNLPKKFILFVGSVEPRKNIKTLILAFDKIKANIEQKLVIVGGRGWLNSEIFQIIKQKKLNEYITFTGYVSENDLVLIYNLADLFIYPSFYEGFGIPVLEAMACGVPVITSNTSSLPEIAGEAAILFDPFNCDILSSSIRKVLNDAILKKKMIAQGLKQVKTFSFEKTARKTLSLFSPL